MWGKTLTLPGDTETVRGPQFTDAEAGGQKGLLMVQLLKCALKHPNVDLYPFMSKGALGNWSLTVLSIAKRVIHQTGSEISA